jgi:putative addiction module killer protein
MDGAGRRLTLLVDITDHDAYRRQVEYTVKRTIEFAEWLKALADQEGRDAIVARIVRIQSGLLGDFKNLGGKLSEFRVDVGPGYRLYFTMTGREIVLLLKGGDKHNQKFDIERAREMIDLIDKAKRAAVRAAKKKK